VSGVPLLATPTPVLDEVPLTAIVVQYKPPPTQSFAGVPIAKPDHHKAKEKSLKKKKRGDSSSDDSDSDSSGSEETDSDSSDSEETDLDSDATDSSDSDSSRDKKKKKKSKKIEKIIPRKRKSKSKKYSSDESDSSDSSSSSSSSSSTSSASSDSDSGKKKKTQKKLLKSKDKKDAQKEKKPVKDKAEKKKQKLAIINTPMAVSALAGVSAGANGMVNGTNGGKNDLGLSLLSSLTCALPPASPLHLSQGKHQKAWVELQKKLEQEQAISDSHGEHIDKKLKVEETQIKSESQADSNSHHNKAATFSSPPLNSTVGSSNSTTSLTLPASSTHTPSAAIGVMTSTNWSTDPHGNTTPLHPSHSSSLVPSPSPYSHLDSHPSSSLHHTIHQVTSHISGRSHSPFLANQLHSSSATHAHSTSPHPGTSGNLSHNSTLQSHFLSSRISRAHSPSLHLPLSPSGYSGTLNDELHHHPNSIHTHLLHGHSTHTHGHPATHPHSHTAAHSHTHNRTFSTDSFYGRHTHTPPLSRPTSPAHPSSSRSPNASPAPSETYGEHLPFQEDTAHSQQSSLPAYLAGKISARQAEKRVWSGRKSMEATKDDLLAHGIHPTTPNSSLGGTHHTRVPSSASSNTLPYLSMTQTHSRAGQLSASISQKASLLSGTSHTTAANSTSAANMNSASLNRRGAQSPLDELGINLTMTMDQEHGEHQPQHLLQTRLLSGTITPPFHFK